MTTFDPAFDMPTTPEEAVRVINEWGSVSNGTFRHDKARRCADLLWPVICPQPPMAPGISEHHD